MRKDGLKAIPHLVTVAERHTRRIEALESSSQKDLNQLNVAMIKKLKEIADVLNKQDKQILVMIQEQQKQIDRYEDRLENLEDELKQK